MTIIFANQKLKFDVSKIEILFYQFRYYFKIFVFQVDRLVSIQNDVIPENL